MQAPMSVCLVCWCKVSREINVCRGKQHGESDTSLESLGFFRARDATRRRGWSWLWPDGMLGHRKHRHNNEARVISRRAEMDRRARLGFVSVSTLFGRTSGARKHSNLERAVERGAGVEGRLSLQASSPLSVALGTRLKAVLRHLHSFAFQVMQLLVADTFVSGFCLSWSQAASS